MYHCPYFEQFGLYTEWPDEALWAVYDGIATSDKVKRAIEDQVFRPESKLRTLMGTIAIYIGLNIRDIRNVFYIGCPTKFSDFGQAVGRGGRDGGWAECWLAMNGIDKKLVGVDVQMLPYFENTMFCRCEMFYKQLEYPWPLPDEFKIIGPCCDICTPDILPAENKTEFEKVSSLHVTAIRAKLSDLRAQLSSLQNFDGQLIPTDVLAGLDETFIDKILRHLRLGTSLDGLGWKEGVRHKVVSTIQEIVPNYPVNCFEPHYHKPFNTHTARLTLHSTWKC